MAKDPAFLFYPGDWNLGTMHLTLLEKGCYIELLILQFAKGKFTEAQAKHMLSGSFDIVWTNLREKFCTDGTFYWNKRLKVEKEKREKFSESRRSNALVNKKGEKNNEAYAKHMDKHMENENINENTVLNKEEKSEKKTFNTKPISSDFNGLPENYIRTSIELVRITAQYDITEKIVLGMWNIFKNQKLTGCEYYANEGKVYSHFVDWIKKQKFSNGTYQQPVTANKFTTGQDKLLAKGQRVYADITGKQGN